MKARRALPFLLIVATGFGMPFAAHAQKIRRCTAADGSTVVTDKPCAAISAAERLPPRTHGTVSAPATGGMRNNCARTLDELSYLVASAIDLRDANRLAGVYHWVGMDGSNAYRVFARLESIVNRPLVDIGPYGGGIDAEPTWREGAEGNLVPVYPKARAPTGLRILQSIGRNGSATTGTVFGLRRHMDCLWISF